MNTKQPKSEHWLQVLVTAKLFYCWLNHTPSDKQHIQKPNIGHTGCQETRAFIACHYHIHRSHCVWTCGFDVVTVTHDIDRNADHDSHKNMVTHERALGYEPSKPNQI